MTHKQKKLLVRIIVCTFLLAAAFALTKIFDVQKYAGLALYLVPFFIAGYDVIYKSVKNIFHGQVFDECFLMTVATIGAIFTGEYAEAVFVMVFYQTGELFQSIAVGKSRGSIAALMNIRPDTANVIRDGVEQEVFPEEVETGETLIIRPGEKVPVDAVVTKGFSSLDTSALTGEAVPRDVEAGDKIISGCINLTGVIEAKTTCAYTDSSVAKILELVENSSFNKSKSENFITKFARVYTPSVVVCAVLLALIPSLITGDVSAWIYRALIFLVVSCPCALVISIPMAFFCGIGRASSVGILIKGANTLEALSFTESAVFDKTGTLTTGEFEITDIFASDGFEKREVLEYAAAAEYYSSHPIAVSIKNACKTSAVPDSTEELSGFGIKAVTGDKVVFAGNKKLMEKENIFVESKNGDTSVFVAVNGKFAGSITLEDKLKPTAEKGIKLLKDCGITDITMLTGDNKAAALNAAGKLGIKNVRYSLLPQEKSDAVAKLCDAETKKQRLVFVGDGINDAPVLTRADIGIAMGALGSDAAIEAADMVITDDDITKIATSIKIAKKTGRVVRQNVIFALAVKFGVLILAAFGLTSMWLGVIADVGVAVAAILNATRAGKVSYGKGV